GGLAVCPRPCGAIACRHPGRREPMMVQPSFPVRQTDDSALVPPKPIGQPVDVAVGILLAADGAVLLAQRPAGKPYAGYWEFPGGKVERDEPILSALARELQEELGVAIQAADAW